MSNSANDIRPGLERLKVFADCLSDELFQAMVETLPSQRFEQWWREGINFYRNTFWYPLDRQPQHLIESVVRALEPAVAPSDAVLGVEWWFSVTRTNGAPLWLLPCHFDRADLNEQHPELTQHPEWASVLFLNQVPYGELVITEQVMGLNGQPDPVNPQQVRFVMPDLNRFAVFPGHLYHGVIGRMWRREEPDRLRVSLAVNWWTQRPAASYLRDSLSAAEFFGLPRHGPVTSANESRPACCCQPPRE